MKVNLHHIDWESSPERLWGIVAVIGNDTAQSSCEGIDDIHRKMYTGDPYKNMEVVIHKSDAKMHFGTVKGTRVNSEGRVMVDVQTLTRTINTVIALDVESVKERQFVLSDLIIGVLVDQLFQHSTAFDEGMMDSQKGMDPTQPTTSRICAPNITKGPSENTDVASFSGGTGMGSFFEGTRST